MRHTRSHTKNRRSHHALKGARLSTTEAGVKHPRHKALLDGTPYRGRSLAKAAPAKKVKPAAEAPKAETKEKKVAKEKKEAAKK